MPDQIFHTDLNSPKQIQIKLFNDLYLNKTLLTVRIF